MFDVAKNKWEDISINLQNSYGYAMHLYKNKLYLSDGRNGIGNVIANLYVYDLNTKEWVQKLPMLSPLVYHLSFQKNDKIHFVFGHTKWSYNFRQMLSYDINNRL